MMTSDTIQHAVNLLVEAKLSIAQCLATARAMEKMPYLPPDEQDGAEAAAFRLGSLLVAVEEFIEENMG